ncbi:MAG: DUF4091 domain-containing protein [Clostridiales bacterium]|nr:DUF4091 domain-containing protein [Clostridiales bacterium]
MMRETLSVKFISSLEKCFLDEKFEDKPALKSISMLNNEHLSVQYLMYESDLSVQTKLVCKVKVVSDLADCITLRGVEQVNVSMPATTGWNDDNYLRKTPGLYPDLLTPLRYDGCALASVRELRCLWVDIRPNGKYPAGKYPVTIELYDEQGQTLYASASLEVEIIGAALPEQKLIYTQWFYADTLAVYYNVEMFSERHWEIIENYIKAAVDGGINAILTPILTPPLDTKVGGERPTNQLVDIYVNNGVYSFGFDKLDRWIDLLLKYNVKIIEMSHLFTQWGAKHAPKVIATVDGVTKKIFGWETDARSDEYGDFLVTFLKALLAYLKEKGVDQMCCYHISDEPHLDHLESYIAAKSKVQEVLKDYPIIDALSDIDFYKTGAVEHPVPGNNTVEAFIEEKVEHLWTYYCCSQAVDVSNRFVAMPSARNRIISTQFYKYDIEGFLHWGFNFYFNRFSDSLVNPYQDASGDYFVPAGDAFSVYPKADGTALDTIHFLVFKHAIEDLRAMELCESLYDKDYVMELIEGDLYEKITFTKYPKDAEYLLTLREKLNAAIKAKL